MRNDGRKINELRNVVITPNYIKHAEGSVLIEFGDTKVICTASIEDSVPPFRKDSGLGWVTAEYAMLPRATNKRNQRDISKLRLNNRSSEIQRLVGRSLRSIVDFSKLGERTITIDCDVIQADGGTRTASITGGFVAMSLAMNYLKNQGIIKQIPIKNYLGAISVGITNEGAVLDLNYIEDSRALVDMNVVMTDAGEFIEVQGTAEGRPFNHDELNSMLSLAKEGIEKLIDIQKKVLKGCVI